jgi:hypothetical protein
MGLKHNTNLDLVEVITEHYKSTEQKPRQLKGGRGGKTSKGGKRK